METSSKKSSVVWVCAALVIVSVGGVLSWPYLSEWFSPKDFEMISEDTAALDIFGKLSQAKTLIEDGHFADALPILKDIESQATGSEREWDVALQYGHAYVGMGEFDKARASYAQVMKGTDSAFKEASARIGGATILASQGDMSAAVKELNTIVDDYEAKKLPDMSGKALFAMSDLHARAGNLGAMRASLARVIDEFPGSERSDANKAIRRIEGFAKVLADSQAEQIAKLVDESKAKRVGSIAAGTTVSWTADEGPYLIEEPLTLPADSVVKIAPGTELRFGADGGLRVLGRLEAVGTAEAPIRCMSVSDDPAAAWWSGFHFEAADGATPSVLTHVHVVSAESAVHVVQGTVNVTECDVQMPVRYGLHSVGNGNVVAKNCRITGGAYEGIRCEEGGTVSVEGGRVTEQAMTGITIKTTASVTLAGVTVEKNRGNGVVCRDKGSGKIENCKLVSNGRAGLVCRGDSSPRLIGCEIDANGGEGVTCLDRSKPEITSTMVRRNTGGGMRWANSAGKITDSKIESNEAFGIWCKLSSPEIVGNAITANAEVGVWIVEGGQPKLTKNRFSQKSGPAVRNHTSNVIDARENAWGSVDPAAIGKLIEDRSDNEQWGEVVFDPPMQMTSRADEKE